MYSKSEYKKYQEQAICDVIFYFFMIKLYGMKAFLIFMSDNFYTQKRPIFFIFLRKKAFFYFPGALYY